MGVPIVEQRGQPFVLHGNQSLVVGPQASEEWGKGDCLRKRTAVSISTQYSQHWGICAVLANMIWARLQHAALGKPDMHI